MAFHLDRFKIHAFRQLKGLELKGLGRVNLLVGANNSGKTTVLEAIAAHCQPLEPMAWLEIARRREIKSSREPILDSIKWLFPQTGSSDVDDPYFQGRVQMEAEGTTPNLETIATYEGFIGERPDDEADWESENGVATTPDPSSYRERGARIHLSTTVRTFDSLIYMATPDPEGKATCDEEFELWESRAFKAPMREDSTPKSPTATVSPFAHRVEPLQVSQWSKLRHAGIAESDLLNAARLIDPEIEGFELLDRTGIRSSLFVKHRITGLTPVSVLGDGLRRAIAIALNLFAARDGVLLIDEIESAIHKDGLGTLFGWLTKMAQQHNVQLFVTTHSLEAVDALVEARFRQDDGLLTGFRLPKTNSGEIVARYSGSSLDELRHGGLEVR
ncbi:MAG: AAA family ATPase [Pirellulaceae bacterium]